MGVGVSIIDRLTKRTARVDERHALAVTQRAFPWSDYTLVFKPFFNPVYGIDMNINAAYSGTPEPVHDGTDHVYWTGSAISGVKFVFNSTAQNHTPAGTKSVLSDRSVTGNTAQFLRSSPLNLSSYVAITFWVYVDDNWDVNDSILLYGWNTATAAMVGIPVAIEDLIDYNSFDKWQKAAVPLSQMNLSGATINALRMQVATIDGLPPRFFIDDIQVEEAGTPVTYYVKPDTGKILYPQMLKVSLAAVYSTDQADGTVPKIAYDDFLGESLTNGVLFRINSQSPFALPIRTLADILQIPEYKIQNIINDGTNTFMTIVSDVNFAMNGAQAFKSSEDDFGSITIQDDLTGLLSLRVIIEGIQVDE